MFDIIKSDIFTKKAGKLLKKQPELIPIFKQVLIKLQDNPYDLSLKSHKLKGKLKDSYACSINYNYRIIFKIFLNFNIEGTNRNIIFLETIGTHDEVIRRKFCRFTTPDLLWSAFPAQTPYHYAYNSPLTYRDPSGLKPEKENKINITYILLCHLYIYIWS
jgi:mRNA-degrading endonuclease YafQ of YafQ-DinJ toxin-antitoxin module